MINSVSIKTTCPYCGVGCGVDTTVHTHNHTIEVKGDQQHPANLGRLCSKGSALAETVSFENRLLYPHMGDQQVDWETALSTVAHKIQQTIQQHGPDAVAFYVSGQLLTEDYYVANKLIKGFIGCANIDTNSRLCMSSSVAGHKRAFGSDTVPGNYEDLEQAELLILTGSNLAWCHPVLFQRIKAAKQQRPDMKLVVIDPRATDCCDIADLHLALKPGTDTLLFNGLLQYLVQQGHADQAYLNQYTEGFDAALAQAAQTSPSITGVAAQCGLTEQQVQQLYQWFGATSKVITLYSQGVNQSSAGTDKVNSIINCHLATGRIGLPGMGPFSITGQPNAMGGREVGGLANMLAAHMDLDNAAHRDLVGRFWQVDIRPDKPGLKAVDLFNAVELQKVKLVWIMATNPVVSLPNANQVRHALRHCETVIVSDCIADTDTVAEAHIKLPAAPWSEKDGTVTNSERRISRQRALFPLAGECKPDWWIISEVAKRMGFADAFNFQSAYDVFMEHARLSAFENQGQRDFDLSGLCHLTAAQYDALQPIQWPVNAQHPDGRARMFDDGRYFTPSQKARLIPIQFKAPVNALTSQYPLILNTGRVRDHWHTLTRTGLSPRLSAHISEPFVAIHPTDAEFFNVQDQQLVQISSHWGQMVARAQITTTQCKGQIFVPMHWTEAQTSQGRVGALVNPEVDPVSGQPELKHTPVAINPLQMAWQGYLLSRRKLDLSGLFYWVEIKGNGYYRYQLASPQPLETAERFVRDLLCNEDTAQWIEFKDASQHAYRAARIVDDYLDSCFFMHPTDVPDPSWLGTLFEQPLSDEQRHSLLAGRAADGEDIGPIVCACFSVGRNTLLNQIKADNLCTVEQIGQCLKAGTNCGSCVPELKQLLQHSK